MEQEDAQVISILEQAMKLFNAICQVADVIPMNKNRCTTRGHVQICLLDELIWRKFRISWVLNSLLKLESGLPHCLSFCSRQLHLVFRSEADV